MTRVLLTGSTGFIGSALHRRLAAESGVRLRLLRRDTAATDPGLDLVPGDLAVASSLAGVCDGVDVLVHAASYVGPDPDACDRVNHQGTASLLHEARRAGVSRIVSMSTASVYGSGPHTGITEDAMPPAPQSPVSRSRAAAETLVRAAGGTVVRPHLVYGPGDRWVVPTLAAALAALPGWVDGGEARMSMIHVADLARLTCALALHPPPGSPGAAYHANHPRPVRLRAAGEALRRHLGIPLPTGTITYDQALRRLPAGFSRRHLDMLSADHWYASDRLWALTGCRPGRPFPDDLSQAPQWYPDLLQPADGGP